MLPFNQMVFYSRRILAVTTKRSGIEGGSGSITTSIHGERISRRRHSWNWSTTIVHPGCSVRNSPGLQAYGVSYPINPNIPV